MTVWGWVEMRAWGWVEEKVEVRCGRRWRRRWWRRIGGGVKCWVYAD
jgi:hypothetical protein